MGFIGIFFGILIILFGLGGFIIYPILALESDDPKFNFFPIVITVFIAIIFASVYATSDDVLHNFNDKTGILSIDVYDSKKQVKEVRVNHITAEREWKFF